MHIRRIKAVPKKRADGQGTARRDRGKTDLVELLRNLAAVETKGSIENGASEIIPADNEMPDAPMKSVKPILSAMPHPRFNAQLAVQDDILYILGGTYEQGDAEYTFDEM